jgi:hypothetical protein
MPNVKMCKQKRNTNTFWLYDLEYDILKNKIILISKLTIEFDELSF